MALEIQEKDSKFRVVWQDFSTDWILDRSSNRKATLVFPRSLHDISGKRLFTFQELSSLFDSNNRQASSQHMEDFRDCGCDFLSYLTRKRKVDFVVVEAVRQELRCDPLASLGELQERVNARLERNDLTEANMKAAMEQISYVDIRDSVLSQLYQFKNLMVHLSSGTFLSRLWTGAAILLPR